MITVQYVNVGGKKYLALDSLVKAIRERVPEGKAIDPNKLAELFESWLGDEEFRA